MSFLNAGTFQSRFVRDWTKSKPENLMLAILDARSRNRTITEKDLKVDDGKLRELRVTYYPPVCNDTGDCTTNVCSTATPITPKQMTYKLSQCTASAVYSLAKDDIRLVDADYDFSDHAMQQMASVMPTVRHKMAVSMASLLVSHTGILPNGNTTRQLPFANAQTGVAQPVGMWAIEQTFYDSGYSDPFIVGGTAVFNWEKSTEIGGLAASGIYLDRMRRNNLYYDSLLNTTFNNGQENVIAFDPQMLKFISFNKHAGLFSTDKKSLEDITSMFKAGMPGRIEGVMADSFTGLIWDLDIKYDDTLFNCTGGWKFQIFLNWDIFFMPPSVCNIQGVNGIFRFTTCAPVIPPCETGSIIAPTASRTFTYNASGFTYPTLIQKEIVAGVTTYPSQNAAASVANITDLVAQLNAGAPAGISFQVSGSNIIYTGYTAVTVVINDTITMTFA